MRMFDVRCVSRDIFCTGLKRRCRINRRRISEGSLLDGRSLSLFVDTRYEIPAVSVVANVIVTFVVILVVAVAAAFFAVYVVVVVVVYKVVSVTQQSSCET